jgi:hypothetical protein
MAFDLSTAQPVSPAAGGFNLATAQPVNPPAPQSGLDSALATLNRIGSGVVSAGPLETAAHVASGAVGGLGGGLTYLGTLAASGDPDAAKAVQEATQKALTYQPRTSAGKAIANAADKALGLIGTGLNKAGEVTTDTATKLGASPEVAAGLGTTVNVGGNAALQLAGLRGMLRGGAGSAGGLADEAADQAAVTAPTAPTIKAAPTTPAELTQQSLDNGQAAGYRVTPNYDPSASLFDRLVQGVTGKATSEQAARLANQSVTNSLGATALGKPAGALLTPQVLQEIRQHAIDTGYTPIKDLPGTIPADVQFLKNNATIKAAHGDELSGNPDVAATADLLNKSTFDPAKITDQISTLRSRAQDAYAAGRPSAGSAFKAQAAELEALIDRHLQSADSLDPNMLTNYRHSRQLIAKTYTVGDALNPSTGNVDATSLGQRLANGGYVDGNLKTIADFANSAPDLAKVPRGGPMLGSPLGLYAGVAGAHATGGLSLAIPAARAFATNYLLRRKDNEGMLQSGTGTLGQKALDAVHGSASAFQHIYSNSGGTIGTMPSPAQGYQPQ